MISVNNIIRLQQPVITPFDRKSYQGLLNAEQVLERARRNALEFIINSPRPIELRKSHGFPSSLGELSEIIARSNIGDEIYLWAHMAKEKVPQWFRDRASKANVKNGGMNIIPFHQKKTSD